MPVYFDRVSDTNLACSRILTAGIIMIKSPVATIRCPGSPRGLFLLRTQRACARRGKEELFTTPWNKPLGLN